jgi:hypothetical protein
VSQAATVVATFCVCALSLAGAIFLCPAIVSQSSRGLAVCARTQANQLVRALARSAGGCDHPLASVDGDLPLSNTLEAAILGGKPPGMWRMSVLDGIPQAIGLAQISLGDRDAPVSPGIPVALRLSAGHLRLQRCRAEINNLLDRHYQNPIGFLQQGLGVYAGIRVAFDTANWSGKP